MTSSQPHNSTTQKPVINNRDLLALKAYVQAKDATQYENVHKDTVILDLTHSNLIQQHIEIRFDLHDTIERLRQTIHRKTGTGPAFQHLQVKSAGQILVEIPPEHSDATQLGYFGLAHGMQVHCVDLDPHSGSRGGQYEDTSLVEKYQMSDAEYDRRQGTLREWGREQKRKDQTFTLAKHAREHREMVDAQRQHKLGLPLPDGFVVDATGQVVRDEPDVVEPTNQKSSNSVAVSEEFGPESVENIQVGQRCQVEPGARRGAVAFVGEVPEYGGYWVGVIFDEPVGKTDGTVASSGKRYFEAMERCGGFVRAKNMQVGDFPERDLFEDDDSGDDEDEL